MACRALARRCPGYSKRQIVNAFEKAVRLYSVAGELVSDHTNDLWACYRGDNVGAELPAALIEELTGRFPGFRKSTLHHALWMTFYYWHLR